MELNRARLRRFGRLGGGSVAYWKRQIPGGEKAGVKGVHRRLERYFIGNDANRHWIPLYVRVATKPWNILGVVFRRRTESQRKPLNHNYACRELVSVDWGGSIFRDSTVSAWTLQYRW